MVGAALQRVHGSCLLLSCLGSALVFGVAPAARAEPPAESVRIDEVTPETFGAGATLTVVAAGLRDGDRYRLGTTALELVELRRHGATLRVPAGVKRGGPLSVQRGTKTLASFAKLRFLSAPVLAAAQPRS